MKKYNGLLSKISEAFCIFPGFTEAELSWKQRILYSVTGLIGYASLWDTSEDGERISVAHFKQRMKRCLSSYLALYPEITNGFDIRDDTFFEEVYQILRLTGCLYHAPYRIAPPAFSAAASAGIIFMRGQGISELQRISGLGAYAVNSINKTERTVEELFGLNPSLNQIWRQWIGNASWDTASLQDGYEYLRTTPPFSYGYWMRDSERKQGISLVRCGLPGAVQYYLYRQENGAHEICQLPQWLVSEHHYRILACAILAHNGTLPPTVWHRNGQVVSLRLNYLYPPEELYFLKLYSWPTVCHDFPHDFSRVMNADVFAAIKEILEQKGYPFTEE